MNVSKREAGFILVAINAMFPKRFPLPTAPDAKTVAVEVWHTLLKDLPAGEALKACHQALASAEHPPTAATIRKIALADVLDHLTGADAWDLVCRSISADGMDRPKRARARWKDPAITASVNAIGGWRSVCLSENVTADRAQFIRHYDGQLERAKAAVLSGKSPTIQHALVGRRERIDGAQAKHLRGLLGRGDRDE